MIINGTPYGTPTPQYVTYGGMIDEDNSNPLTAVTYIDDAIGMVKGSTAWDSKPIFRDIKPCLLKNGIVHYYLDPHDFTKKADGTPADITSGNDGDVMIEFSYAGFQFTSPMANKPEWRLTTRKYADATAYNYDPLSRYQVGDRDKFYVGAYLGWVSSGKLRSLSGKTPTANQTIATFRAQAQANGIGYQQLTWGIVRYLQVLFLLRYGNRDSQSALGQGLTRGTNVASTGATNYEGMYYGNTTNGNDRVKFAGIEDIWGNLTQWVDGLYINSSSYILTAYKDFNDTAVGYTNGGRGSLINDDDIPGYLRYTQATNAGGALISQKIYGSESTYYTDYARFRGRCLPDFGGSWGDGAMAGIFKVFINWLATEAAPTRGARLCYI